MERGSGAGGNLDLGVTQIELNFALKLHLSDDEFKV